MKRYIIINPEIVVELGINALESRIKAGKIEVECDIAAFLFYPCLAVVKSHASYADVTAAFNYKGFWCKDGCLTYPTKRLIQFFVVEAEDEENVYIRFNTDAKEDDEIFMERIRVWEDRMR